MFERFTERARQVVILAQEEARRMHHERITTAHLVLGLACEEEGLAARVLESYDVDAARLRRALLDLHPAGDADAPAPAQMPFTAAAKVTLEKSLREALSLGHNYIGTEHLLLALARGVSPATDEGGEPGHALLVLGAVDLDESRLRNEVIRKLRGRRDDPPRHAPERDALFAHREQERFQRQQAAARQQTPQPPPQAPLPGADPAVLVEALAGAVHTLQAVTLALQAAIQPQPETTAPPAESHLYKLMADVVPALEALRAQGTPDIREPQTEAQRKAQEFFDSAESSDVS